MRVLAIASLVGAALVVGAPTSQAAPVTKTVTVTCKGVTPADDATLGLIGSPNFPVTITSDVPPTLEPEQSGSPISFQWRVILDTALVNTAVGFGVTNVVVKNAVADMAVTGPTSTTVVPSGTLPDIVVNLAAGQPADINIGTFSGTLQDVGSSGNIAYTPGRLAFTISVPALADVAVTCSTTSKAAVTQIKVPGSPNIVQPIQESAGPNEQVTIDVLSKYVTAGTTKDGRTLEVDATSLKIVDGPATIVDGKLQVTGGAAGSTTSITFEVCAVEKLEGANAVQTLTLDKTSDALKKGIAFTIGTKDNQSPPVDLLSGTNALGIPDPKFLNFTAPAAGRWKFVANEYIPSTHQLPSAAELEVALSLTPGIGPGNVKVTRTGTGVYDIEFINGLGQKNVDLLTVGNYWSVLPQELLDEIIAAASSLLGSGGGGGGPTTTLPGGSAAAYRAQLNAAITAAANSLNFGLAAEKIGELFQFEVNQLVASIDTGAAISFLKGLFTNAPLVQSKVEGEAPGGICSQGLLDLVVAGGPGTDVEGIVEVSGLDGRRLGFTG